VHDIYVATAVLMAATVVQMAVIYAIDRKMRRCRRHHAGDDPGVSAP
jgi:intracellular septation protein A